MFLTRVRAEDRSPWGGFWFSPVGMRVASGVRINADSAMTLSAVFRAVSLVSGHMALLPIKFYRRGTRKRILNHSLLRVLNVRPNRFQNAFEWREMLQGHLELRGNAYCEIVDDGKGIIKELVPRHPDRVSVEVSQSGDYRYRIAGQNGESYVLPRGAVWHLRGLSSDGVVGMSTVSYARESFGLGIAAQQYGARFFANDAKPTSGWIKYPGAYKDKTQREEVRESLQAAQSDMNRGKLMLLDYGMEYNEVGLNNEDAQFIQSRQFQVTEIARWFGVPPHKIGDLSRATFSNIEQQSLEYIQDGLQPRASRIEASVEAELLLDDEEIDVEFDFAELLRGDSAARAAYYHNGILDGWLVRNEAREQEGFEPIDGLDNPLMPLNMTEEGAKKDEPAEPKENARAARLDDGQFRRVVESSCRRLARRAVSALEKKSAAEVFDDAFASLIADSLGVFQERAALCCSKLRNSDVDVYRALLACATGE